MVCQALREQIQKLTREVERLSPLEQEVDELRPLQKLRQQLVSAEQREQEAREAESRLAAMLDQVCWRWRNLHGCGDGAR